MDNLVTSSASNEFDVVQRSAIRRSFRTLKKRITNSSSILRQTSIERQESKLRRRNSARSQSAVRAPSSATSTEPIHYTTSRSTNSIEQDISFSSSRGALDVADGPVYRNPLELRLSSCDRSRPSSAASYDILSNCSSSNRVHFYDEDCPPTLPLKSGEDEIAPPSLPPKTNRPLGGLNVFTPSKERYSLISSDSRDSFLNDKFDFSELSDTLKPPELPEKTSPVKGANQNRDSGYNEVASDPILIGTPEQIVDKVLSEKVKADVVDAFLSSYRTFLGVDDLVDVLLKRIRKSDSCQTVKGLIPLQILLRIIDQIVHTELGPELFTKLSDEIFWMMTHRETEFMKFAKQLREHIMKKWEAKASQPPLPPISSDDLKDHLRKQGQDLIEFSSDRIAQQLTLTDVDLYRKIEASEFVISSMGENYDREKAPNFTLGVNHFNALSYWVQCVILTQKSPNKDAQEIREKIMTKFFNVLINLRRMQNFNSYFALVVGISSKAVARLNWKTSYHEKIADFQNLTNVEKNFSNYRGILKDAQLPCIPYIGLIKQDLYQVHLREKPTTDGLVNFKKVKKLHRQLEHIRRFRDSKFEFPQDPELIRLFGGFRCIQDDEELWQLSYSIKEQCTEP